MRDWKIIDQKTVQSGDYVVVAQKHDEPGHQYPHQVLFSTVINGIERAELWSYPAGVTGNRDCDYAFFDERKAAQLVARFLKQLANPKHAVAKLAAGQ